VVVAGREGVPVDRAEHEAGFEAFLKPQRKERWRKLIGQSKTRAKLLAELHHFADVDARWRLDVSRERTSGIADRLVSMGAPEICHVMSDSELDGQTLRVRDALDAVVGSGMGTVLLCVPGELAYLETEDDRCILRR